MLRTIIWFVDHLRTTHISQSDSSNVIIKDCLKPFSNVFIYSEHLNHTLRSRHAKRQVNKTSSICFHFFRKQNIHHYTKSKDQMLEGKFTLHKIYIYYKTSYVVSALFTQNNRIEMAAKTQTHIKSKENSFLTKTYLLIYNFSQVFG